MEIGNVIRFSMAPPSAGVAAPMGLPFAEDGGQGGMAVAPSLMPGSLAGPAVGRSPETQRLAEEKAFSKMMQDRFNKECETCKNRTYQDGSNDPGVSFKSAAHIDPSVSASVVMGHEQEHVAHEQARAEQEGNKVVDSKVRLHGAFCPECGRYYIAGGVTETTVRSGGGKNENHGHEPEAGAAGFDISA